MLWLSWLGFISTPWQLFFMDLGSTLWNLGSALWGILPFLSKVLHVCFWVIVSICFLNAKVRNPKPSLHFVLTLSLSVQAGIIIWKIMCCLMCQCIIYFIKPKSYPQTSLILSFLYLVLPVWNFHEILHLVFLETLYFKCRRFLRHTLKILRGPAICLKVYIWVTLLNLPDVLTKAVTHQPGFDLYPEVISQFLI